MGYIIDRAKERIGRVKADRATEQGIAGHQAAMSALSHASGHGRIGGLAGDQLLWMAMRSKKNTSKIEPGILDPHKP